MTSRPPSVLSRAPACHWHLINHTNRSVNTHYRHPFIVTISCSDHQRMTSEAVLSVSRVGSANSRYSSLLDFACLNFPRLQRFLYNTVFNSVFNVCFSFYAVTLLLIFLQLWIKRLLFGNSILASNTKQIFEQTSYLTNTTCHTSFAYQ